MKLEIKIRRSIFQQNEYRENVLKMISSENYEISECSLKQFQEEFCVLLDYCLKKYGLRSDIEFQLVDIHGENINYDGEIFFENKTIEKVEITSPLFGENDTREMCSLNKKQHENYVVGDLPSKIDEINQRILEIANKKNRNIHYDDSVTLLINMQDSIHFFKGVDICDEFINKTRGALRNIDFAFKEVYLFVRVSEVSKLYKYL